ncbi:MAG: hypothetical protein FWE19_08270 [Oscillospiraceae bacterium]|nr:hypothetical protein [Oscillospiraceae bacterium]
MLDSDRIFMHFLSMSGTSVAGAGSLRALCDAAGQHLVGRLRGGVSVTENMDRLTLAAAALAYGDWLELGGDTAGTQEVRVGEITLREGGGAAPRGSGIREHFLAGVADLLALPAVVIGTPEPEREGVQ